MKRKKITKKEETQVAIREGFAKLLATENINVRHADVHTAAFDVQNRTLYLPNWSSDMSEDLYTMLITHEVGHALHTPAKEWATIIKDPEMKDIVNIIEDVRIEKLMLDKFPGTRKPFRSAYKEIMKNDFLGLEKAKQQTGKKLREFNLIDRINVHYKAGLYADLPVPFTVKENYWVNRVNQCDTFADVLSLAHELHDYIEQEQEEKQLTVGQGQGQGQGNGSQDQSQGNGQTGHQSGNGFTSETDAAMNDALNKFISNNGVPEHITLPSKMDLSDIIVDHKKLHKGLSAYYTNDSRMQQLELAIETLAKFQNKNKKIINNLVSLFEMKKRAKLSVKSKTSKTGVIDTNKLHTYKYSDDIFKKITTIPKGKSHGLVIMIDLSGSMSTNIYGAFEQIINLALFCRKVNVPFDVYGFTTTSPKGNLWSHDEDRTLSADGSKADDLTVRGSFYLRQYFSSEMNARQFKTACRNVMAVANGHNYRHGSGRGIECTVPRPEQLGGTPLDEAIIASMQLVNNMKKRYRLDIMNTIFITDGESNQNLHVRTSEGYSRQVNLGNDIFIKDEKTGKTWRCTGEDDNGQRYRYIHTTKNLLSILKQSTGCNTIGFYLTNPGNIAYSIMNRNGYNGDSNSEHKRILSEIETKGFIESNEHGYDAYYYIEDGDGLETGSNDISETMKGVDAGDTKAIEAAFQKSVKARKRDRVILSRFIDNIAKINY